MKRSLCVALAVAVALSLSSCKGDPSTPEYWEKAIGGAKGKKEKMKRLEELRSHKGLDKSFLPVLHKRLAEEKSAEVKSKVALIIGELKDPSSVDPLTEAIDWAAAEADTKAMNKEIAVALGNIGDPKAAPTLLKCLSLKDNYTVIAAIEGLGQMRAKEAVDPLVKFARDENTEPFLSKKAIQALGDIGDPKATEALVDMMFKERRGVSFYVESSFALYQIGDSTAPLLLPVLEGTDKERFKWAEKNGILAPALTAKAAQVLGDLHDARAEKGLINALKFNSEMMDIKLFVRMRAADALGRLRSAAGGKALAAMLDEDEGTAREEYVRALVRIGSRDALPDLIKSGSKGSWDARQEAIEGVAMLGDDREYPAFNKYAEEESKLFTAECKEDDQVKGCKSDGKDAVEKGVQDHVDKIAKWRKILDAGKECKSDNACWAKKLSDGHEGVRARAAYELGRSKDPAMVTELMKHLTEENLETRLAIIQGIDWLVHDSKEAGKAAQAQLAALEKQIAEEKGKTQFIKVNEDLRRLAVKIKRSA
jgi:HEAT repeat protein